MCKFILIFHEDSVDVVDESGFQTEGLTTSEIMYILHLVCED